MGLEIRSLSPDDEDVVVDLITQLQGDPARGCPYLGTDRAGIVAELEGLETPWRETALVGWIDGRIVAVTVTDWDLELGRSWIHGPWIVEDWAEHAAAMVDAAIAGTPDDIVQYEVSADPAHEELARLATDRGWRPTEVNLVYVADRSAAASWPEVAPVARPAMAGDVEAITPLHDLEFPGTYYPADRLIADALTGKAIVLIAEDAGQFLGYAAGQVQADGSGFLDYLALTEESRGHGRGLALLVAVGRALIAASAKGEVNLTVQAHRTTAISLYEGLGYRRDSALVAYRSPRPTGSQGQADPAAAAAEGAQE